MEAVGPEREFLTRMARHFGTHLAFWPKKVELRSREKTRECVLLGQQIMKRALDGDLGVV